MVFSLNNRDEFEFINDIESFPDRIVGLVAPIMIEERIRSAIKARLQNTRNVFDPLFNDRTNGSLATFGTLIHLGAALGIYGESAYDDLVQINRIRNLFAHELKAHEFTFQNIADRIKNLKLPDIYPAITSTSIPIQFESDSADEAWSKIIVTHARVSQFGQRSGARDRFLRTIEILSTFLTAIASPTFAPSFPKPRF